MKEIKTLINEALHKYMDSMTDDYTKYGIYDEVSHYLVSAMQLLDKIDKLEDTRQTKEIVYLTSEYRYTDVENRMFLVCRFAQSLHELNETHIYEVTVQRSREDNEAHTIDYVHKAIIIADFDYTNNINERFKQDFEDEVLDAVFDCRFNTISCSIKQLS